jgi:hypothetical protein
VRTNVLMESSVEGGEERGRLGMSGGAVGHVVGGRLGKRLTGGTGVSVSERGEERGGPARGCFG